MSAAKDDGPGSTGMAETCPAPLVALGCCKPQPSGALAPLTGTERDVAAQKALVSKSTIDAALKNSALLDLLRDDALAWSAAFGLMVATTQPNMVHAPCTLLPTPFPRDAYSFAYSVSEDLNALVDRLSRDPTFLNTTLAGVCKVDPFYARLLDIFNTLQKDGVAQPIALGINRSDYMLEPALDGAGLEVKQVELNTISAAGSCMSHNTSRLHRYLMSRHFPDLYDPSAIRENNVPFCLTRAIAMAAYLHPAMYADKKQAVVTPDTAAAAAAAAAKVDDTSVAPTVTSPAVTYVGSAGATPLPTGEKPAIPSHVAILMVVQAEEKNIIDQKILEFLLFNEHGFQLLRRTLGQIAASATIDPKTKDLVIDGKTILVTYFRAGYTPKDYPSDKEWAARLLLEQSRSIKCPNVAYQLCGSKKVQQTVAAAGVLEKYVPDVAAKRIRRSYTGLWPLDNSEKETETIIAKAITDPDSYVLKPQREGGGNNVWGTELVHTLKTASVVERGAYVLMQRIKAVSHRAPLLRNGKVTVEACTSEFGVYSYFIGEGKRTFHNTGCGHLLRTKLANVNEGGVFAGFAVFDSPLIFS